MHRDPRAMPNDHAKGQTCRIVVTVAACWAITFGCEAPLMAAGAESNDATSQGRSISGTWRLNSTCNTGKFVVMLNIRQKSATRFVGSGQGVNSGYRTVIENGRISGTSISFSRRNVKAGARTATHSTGILSADGRRMSGTERSAFWNCKFNARKL